MQAPTIGAVRVRKGDGETVRLARGASLTDFAEKIGVDPASLVQMLFHLGEMVTATESVNAATLELLGEELNYNVQVVSPEDEDRDNVPPDERQVLVFINGHVASGDTEGRRGGGRGIRMGRFDHDGGFWHVGGRFESQVTHWMELPADPAHIGGMVKNISFANARAYFRLGLDPAYAG